MKNLLFQTVLVVGLGACPQVFAEPDPIYELEPVVVTASRIPTTFSDLCRSVVVIGRGDMQAFPVHSVQDALQYAHGVDLRQRGPLGVQADVSIRGATFEQTLILVDGIKMTDPQTGHHSLDIPLTLDDIERIEVLRGQGSSLYGPNAFGGVINIITRKDRAKQASLRATLGGYGLHGGCISLSCPIGASRHRLSAERRKSSGYRYNTRFDITTASYAASVETTSGEIDVSCRYLDKKFGANGFYSDRFPDQWEHTTTTTINSRANLRNAGLMASLGLHWRRHKDDFMLDRTEPDWYRSRHTTDVYGVELQSTVDSKAGLTVLGGEVGIEEIESANLGNHTRIRGGLFFEQHLQMRERLAVKLAACAYSYSGWGWRISPDIAIGFQPTKSLRLYGSLGNSFRVPTYTELYYASPANMGNPALGPEGAWTYEVGSKWKNRVLEVTLAVFRREGRDLIDWTRAEDADPWQAQNVASANTNGMELGFEITPGGFPGGHVVSRIRASYAYLDSHKRTDGFESKYLLDHLRHQFLLDISHRLLWRLTQNWRLRYGDRLQDRGTHCVLDTRVSWKRERVELFLEATNIFNSTYSEVGSVLMPGIWIKTGLAVSFTP